MPLFRFIFALGLFLAVAGSFGSYAWAHESEDAGTTIIHITERGFEPERVTIEVGETVVFENIGNKRHWPASNIHPTHRSYPGTDIEKCGAEGEQNMFDACRALPPGETYFFTFTFPGTWKYHDHEFPQFGGDIVVVGAASGTPVVEADSKNIFTRFWDSTTLWFKKAMYTLIPGKLQRDLEGVQLIDIAENNEAALSHWLSILGPQKVMAQLLEESHGDDGSFVRDCHEAAHNVGRESYELFGSEVFQKCSAECHSGCYHGGTEAYFREHGTANLEEDLNVICSSSLNAFFSHQCLHGIGHGLMAWSNYKLFDALDSCTLLSKGQGSCISGVFMENIVGGLAAEQGHFTEYLSEDPHYPCTIVPKHLIDDCYFLQTSRMVQLFGADWERIGEECKKAPEGGRLTCFDSMGRDVGGATRGNPQAAINACRTIPTKQERIWCLRGAVQDSFWDSLGADAARTFCELLKDADEKIHCYNMIFERSTQVFASKKQGDEFCVKMEPAYQEACRTNIALFFDK